MAGDESTRHPTESSRTFDLTAASAKLWPFTRRSLMVEVGVTILLIVMGLVVLAGSWSRLAADSLTMYQAFDLSVIAVIVIGGSLGLLRLASRRVRGAVTLKVDYSGFELIYPSGRRTVCSWRSPRLVFDLADFSDANPTSLPTFDFPYSIVIRGVQSLLTPEAFIAMKAQVTEHRVVESAQRGGTWRFPSDANPMIYRVRGQAMQGDSRHSVTPRSHA